MATALGRPSEGASRTADGVVDAPRAGARVLPFRVGATLGLGLGLGVSGAGDAGRLDGAVGLTAGGASGTRGDGGAEGAVRCRDCATKAATAQVTPAPAAVRTSRRRPAARRSSS